MQLDLVAHFVSHWFNNRDVYCAIHLLTLDWFHYGKIQCIACSPRCNAVVKKYHRDETFRGNRSRSRSYYDRVACHLFEVVDFNQAAASTRTHNRSGFNVCER